MMVLKLYTDRRKGFHSAAVPVALRGIGGPGAPRVFHLQRICDAGTTGLTLLRDACDTTSFIETSKILGPTSFGLIVQLQSMPSLMCCH